MKKALTISMIVSFVVILSALGSASVATGNWYLQASSQVVVDFSRVPELGGSLAQTDSTISGVLHVSNSSCFDWATNVPVSGSLDGDTVTLTSEDIVGQVITITGSATPGAIKGGYSIVGGCADGDHGTITAVLVSPSSGNWTGAFTSEDTSQPATASFVQDAPNVDGYSRLSGTLTLTGSQCFTAGTLVPEQSWSLGNIIQAVVTMSDGSQLVLNGFITDASTNARHMTVNYSVTGGSCSGQSGSATFERP